MLLFRVHPVSVGGKPTYAAVRNNLLVETDKGIVIEEEEQEIEDSPLKVLGSTEY